LAFGLIKLFAKTEEGVSISPPKNASLVSVCRYNGHCPLTRLQVSLFVPPLRKYILLLFTCIIPDLLFVSFKYKVGWLLLIMILLVDVIFSLVKVSIFPPMTSMVEKLPVFMFAVPLELIVLMLPVFMFAVPLELIVLMLPVFMFAKFVTVNKPETKIVVVKPSSSND